MNAVLDHIRTIVSSGFIRAVALLVGGTAIAHVIFALSLPIATRLYSPEDFSLLALFTATVSIISVAACLRFDIAVPMPETEEEAVNLLALAVTSTLVVSTLAALPALLAPDWTAALLNRPDSAPYLWLFPVGILFASLFSAFQFWMVRRKAFRGIAGTRIAQATAASATQVGLGLAKIAPTGLILGQTLNFGAGFIVLAYRFLRNDRAALASVSLARMRACFSAYSRFPRYSTLEALFNSASIYLPVVLISSLAAGPQAGFVILAMQVMQAPMSLIGAAIAQVYFSRAPEEHRNGRLGLFTATIFGGLLKSGVGPLLFAGLVAPEAFAVIFGAEWRAAGELVVWMTPWFVLQFLSSPVSVALHVTGRLRLALVLQVFGLLFRVGMLYATYVFSRGLMSESYALSGLVFYFIYIATVLRVTAAPGLQIAREIGRSMPVIAIWIIAGVATSFAAGPVLDALHATYHGPSQLEPAGN